MKRKALKVVEVLKSGWLALFLCLMIWAGPLAAQNNLDKYDHFSGKLAGQRIKLVLHKDKGKWSGVYYYEKYKTPIELVPIEEFKNGEGCWVLVEKEKGKKLSKSAPQWIFEEKDGKIIGQWKDINREKTYPIDLVRDSFPRLAFKNIVLKKTYEFPEYRMKEKEYQDYTVQTSFDYNVLEAIETTPTAEALNFWTKKTIYIDSSLSVEAGLYKEFERMNTAIEEEAQQRVAVNADLFGMHWEKGMHMKIGYNKNDILELLFSDEFYGGGAHGDFGEKSLVFDLRKDEKMQLSDVMVPMEGDAKEEFRSLLVKGFEEAYEQKIEEVIFANKIKIPEKFSLNDEGITFIYGTYEVAAFAYGVIKIYISYNDLFYLLRKDFIKRMNLQDICN